MSNQLEFTIESDIQKIPLVRERIVTFAKQSNLSSDVVFSAKVALSELLANVISYGYSDEETHTIEVRINLRSNVLELEMIDDGVAFDPTTTKDFEAKTSAHELPTRGMGIHLVKNFVDTIEYQRHGNYNHTFITINVEES